MAVGQVSIEVLEIPHPCHSERVTIAMRAVDEK
jgi:hypothetical protein